MQARGTQPIHVATETVMFETETTNVTASEIEITEKEIDDTMTTTIGSPATGTLVIEIHATLPIVIGVGITGILATEMYGIHEMHVTPVIPESEILGRYETSETYVMFVTEIEENHFYLVDQTHGRTHDRNEENHHQKPRKQKWSSESD